MPGAVIVVAGLVDDEDVYRCAEIARELAAASDGYTVEVLPMLEPDWEVYLAAAKCELGGAATAHARSPLVLLHAGGVERYVGNLAALDALAAAHLGRLAAPTADAHLLREAARNGFVDLLRKTGSQFAFLDIQFGKEKPKKVVIELFVDVCPKTCEVFRKLCTGEDGQHASGARLHYRGSPFHRVVKGAWVQSGDVLHGSGNGQAGDVFADETFAVQFDAPGIVAMANSGPHTNSTQFFITQGPLPYLDKQAVAFGRVVSGIKVLRFLDRVETANERPFEDVKIHDSGEVNLASGFGIH
ncbi:cyclophilin-like domain-containing protein [Pelagophyceae sp. CCMP2097]|nr:cyclophilin-like domain-containing protein [Pelagophyceae sp. CCMP2097]